jgi:hypothetical protein
MTQLIPAAILALPLPPRWFWRVESSDRWGGLICNDGGSFIIRKRYDGDSTTDPYEPEWFEGFEVTHRRTGDVFDVALMSFEEACRFAYAQLMLGNDGP